MSTRRGRFRYPALRDRARRAQRSLRVAHPLRTAGLPDLELRQRHGRELRVPGRHPVPKPGVGEAVGVAGLRVLVRELDAVARTPTPTAISRTGAGRSAGPTPGGRSSAASVCRERSSRTTQGRSIPSMRATITGFAASICGPCRVLTTTRGRVARTRFGAVHFTSDHRRGSATAQVRGRFRAGLKTGPPLRDKGPAADPACTGPVEWMRKAGHRAIRPIAARSTTRTQVETVCLLGWSTTGPR